MKVARKISTVELKQLLVSLIEHHQNTCFRYRLLGEMWQTGFMRIVNIAEKRVMLNDETRNKLVVIHDLDMIVQFELDAAVYGYQPHFHYDVTSDNR
jgi:hypothetical protein